MYAQQTPGSKQTKAITIEGATAHLGNGDRIENALIIFENGKITFIGSATAKIARKGVVINGTGKHVYPGFIIPNSTLGLVEIDAVKATEDDSEIGSWNPHIRSLIAYNAESKVVESMRPNGVLLGQITPRGGRISGTSSIVQFDAWNWEDAAVKTDDGIHLNWPNNFSRGRWWLGEDTALKPNKGYAKQVRDIVHNFNSAKAYLKAETRIGNLPFDALEGLFNGSKKLFIHVNDEKGIRDAIHFAEANAIKNMTIVGGADSYKVTDLLKQHQISVILNRIHSLPNNTDDDYDLPYTITESFIDGRQLSLETHQTKLWKRYSKKYETTD